MSTEYDNELRGALFQNDKGTGAGSERRPDYRGTVQVEGKTYKIAGWKRMTRAGNKPFLSLSFTEDIQEPPEATEETPEGAEADTEEQPF